VPPLIAAVESLLEYDPETGDVRHKALADPENPAKKLGVDDFFAQQRTKSFDLFFASAVAAGSGAASGAGSAGSAGQIAPEQVEKMSMAEFRKARADGRIG